MNEKDLNFDRFLGKDPKQSDSTKDPVYTSVNPTPKRGSDELKKIGRPKGSEEDGGAPNILTGTVIISCFIQTSALPSRIEMQGNDLTFFDDTYELGGTVIGDTSRLIFTHGSAKFGEVIQQGFIWEKRASIHDTYDNVLSLYALPPKPEKMNYMYFGYDGTGENPHTNYVAFNVNRSTGTVSQAIANGAFYITNSTDGVYASEFNFAILNNSIASIAGDGFSIFLTGTGTGIIGIASDILPFAAGCDIGSASQKMGTFYGSVVACPLPTVENPLALLDRIEAPVYVGDRGHYGEDRRYFDDLTFPPELLYTDKKGRTEIEHTTMLGFLLQTVIELKAKVDLLERGRTQM